MNTGAITAFVLIIVIIVCIVILIFIARFLKVWVQAWASKADITMASLWQALSECGLEKLIHQ